MISRRIAIVGVLAALTLSACSSSSKSAPSTSSSSTSTTSETAPGGCAKAGTPPKGSPALAITPGAAYTATMNTTEGTMMIALNTCTQLWGANNFIVLARKGFYNKTTFHRAVKDFVIQGGDPQGNGTGGPGYEFVSELPPNGYKVGDLAWAKTGAAPPGSAGSQFFIITTPQAVNQTFDVKPYLYGQFGTLTSGLDVARKIEALAPPQGDGPPTRTVTITSVTITGP
ncbi:MAG: peptidylprolyl isomerase [Acidimicrobiia bacterium]